MLKETCEINFNNAFYLLQHMQILSQYLINKIIMNKIILDIIFTLYFSYCVQTLVYILPLNNVLILTNHTSGSQQPHVTTTWDGVALHFSSTLCVYKLKGYLPLCSHFTAVWWGSLLE